VSLKLLRKIGRVEESLADLFCLDSIKLVALRTEAIKINDSIGGDSTLTLIPAQRIICRSNIRKTVFVDSKYGKLYIRN
jgi:hypothetical protein